MKKLKKISLHQLEKGSLANQAMRCLKGGNSCTCGCNYANSGGSTTGHYDFANYSDNKTSVGGGNESCACGGSSHVRSSEYWIGSLPL